MIFTLIIILFFQDIFFLSLDILVQDFFLTLRERFYNKGNIWY